MTQKARQSEVMQESNVIYVCIYSTEQYNHLNPNPENKIDQYIFAKSNKQTNKRLFR